MRNHGLLFLIICLLLMLKPITTNAQLSAKQQTTVDSLKQVIDTTTDYKIKLNSWLIWSNTIYYSDPELSFEINQKIYAYCKEKLEEEITQEKRNYLLKKSSGAINTFGVYYQSKGDYDKAIDYFHESLKISEDLGNLKGVSMSLNSLGNIYSDQGNYLEAIHFYTRGLNIDIELDDQAGVAISYSNLGQIYMKQGASKNAIDCYLKALKIQEKIKDRNNTAIILINLGILYRNQDDNSKALDYYKESLDIFNELGNNYGSAACLNNIGNIYIDQKDYKTALIYHEKALVLREELGDQNSIANSLASLGNLYKRTHTYELAEDYLNKGLKIVTQINDQSGIASSFTSLGLLHFEQKKYQSALKYGQKSLKIATDIGDLNEIIEVTEFLWTLNKALNNPSEALKMYELYIQSRDSIQNESKREEVLKQEFKYQFEKQHLTDSLGFVQQQELDQISHQVELEKEAEQRKELILYFSFLLIFCIGIVILLVRERKLKKLVDKANEKYHMLLVESNHRIKNNLQMIISMLEYSSKDLEDKDSFAFKRMSGKIQTISALHKHLYLDVHNERVDMRAYFEEIVSLYQEISNGTFSIQLNIDDISIQSERMVYFGLIFNEMISNTLEHSNSIDKTIYFSSTKSENGFQLVYQDNSSFEISKNGTGIELIEQLIKRIEGDHFKFEGSTGKYQFEFYA